MLHYTTSEDTHQITVWDSYKHGNDANFWAYRGAPYVYSDLFYDKVSDSYIGGTSCSSTYATTQPFSNWCSTVDYYYDISNPNEKMYLFKPGCYPQFTGDLVLQTYGKAYYVERTDSDFIIKNADGKELYHYTISNFKDHTIPKVIYVELQGGGGGGGCGGSSIGGGDGSGGGGGGYIAGILSMPGNWYFSTGHYGIGGTNWSGYNRYGTDGGDTYIGYYDQVEIVAYGGQGGNYRDTDQHSRKGLGGLGGGTYVNSSNHFNFITIRAVSGGNGGTQYDGSKSSATGVGGGTFYHPCFGDDLNGKLSLSEHGPGRWKSGKYCGPGGASQMANGGDSGDNDNGSAGWNCGGGSGQDGSGGGGGRYYFPSIDALKNTGGNGGPGLIILHLGLINKN